MTETYTEYHSESGEMWITTNERSMITKLMKMRENGLKVLRNPQENDGYLYCSVPKSWLKIKPKKKMQLSGEEIERRAALLRNAKS